MILVQGKVLYIMEVLKEVKIIIFILNIQLKLIVIVSKKKKTAKEITIWILIQQ